jgi:hypothetical protein
MMDKVRHFEQRRKQVGHFFLEVIGFEIFGAKPAAFG